MLEVPLTVRVTRYKCRYCGVTKSNRKSAAYHQGRCCKNPSMESCGSCRHDIRYHDVCAVGINSREHDKTDEFRMVRHCPKWSMKMPDWAPSNWETM